MKLQTVTFIAMLLVIGLTACRSRQPEPGMARLPVPDRPAIPILPSSPDPCREMRAVWLTTIYGLDWPKRPAHSKSEEEEQKRELCRILDRLNRDGFNTVFLQVRQRGDLIYPSRYEPFSTVFTGSRKTPTYDPLAFAISECKRRGLACHAWMTTFPLGNTRQSAHSPRTDHPEWCVLHQGEWQLNPGLPNVRSYIANLVTELAEHYPDLAGVHLDYVRYPDFSSTFDDAGTFARYGLGRDKNAWRRDNISELLRLVRSKLDTVAPRMLLSCATLGKLRRLSALPDIGWTAYEDVCQDPLQWAHDKSVDFLIPMMYYRDRHFNPFLADWQKLLSNLPIIPGLGVYRIDETRDPWPARIIGEQIRQIRALQFPGFCFYREGNLNSSREITEIIRTELSAPATPLRFSRCK